MGSIEYGKYLLDYLEKLVTEKFRYYVLIGSLKSQYVIFYTHYQNT